MSALDHYPLIPDFHSLFLWLEIYLTPQTGANQCNQFLSCQPHETSQSVHAKKPAVSTYHPTNQRGYLGFQENTVGNCYVTQFQSPYLSKCGGILTTVSTPPRVSAKGKLQLKINMYKVRICIVHNFTVRIFLSPEMSIIIK